MPSATLVTVPSLRASADSLTLSMRDLISSLISEGLSVVVAIASFPVGRLGRRWWRVCPALRFWMCQCASADCRRSSLPLSEPSMTTSPAAITAPPIRSASTAVSSCTSRPKRRWRASRICATSASGSSAAEVTVASTTRSSSARSSSNMPAISGSTPSRPLSASSETKAANFSPEPSGASRVTASSLVSAGCTSRPSTRGSPATRAANASACDHCAAWPSSRATAKAARAYGRAMVVDIGSDLRGEFVEQRLVRVGVDLALEQALGAAHRQQRHLPAQVLAGAGGRRLDLGVDQRLLPQPLGDRLGLGGLDDLGAAPVRLVDDLVGLGARRLEFGVGGFLRLGQRTLAVVGRGQALGDLLLPLLDRIEQRRPHERGDQPDQAGKGQRLGD